MNARERRDEALRLACSAVEDAADSWELDDLDVDDDEDIRKRLRAIAARINKMRTLNPEHLAEVE